MLKIASEIKEVLMHKKSRKMVFIVYAFLGALYAALLVLYYKVPGWEYRGGRDAAKVLLFFVYPIFCVAMWVTIMRVHKQIVEDEKGED